MRWDNREHVDRNVGFVKLTLQCWEEMVTVNEEVHCLFSGTGGGTQGRGGRENLGSPWGTEGGTSCPGTLSLGQEDRTVETEELSQKKVLGLMWTLQLALPLSCRIQKE